MLNKIKRWLLIIASMSLLVACSPFSLNSTLLKAVYNGQYSIVNTLLQQNIDVNQTNQRKQTALMLAAYNGNSKIVTLLAQHGAKLNLTDINGNTALMYASVVGDSDVVKTLLCLGAKVNVNNKNGITALLAAAISYVVARFILGRLLKKATKLTETKWDDTLANWGVFGHLAYFAPALVLYLGIDQYPAIAGVGRRIISAYVAINVVVVLNRLLSAGQDIYLLSAVSEKRPIKAFVQLAKLVLWVIGMDVVV